MAKQIQEIFIDDIDGSEAEETIAFVYRGRSYEIDLSNTHATAFDESMKEWIEHAREVRTETGRRGRPLVVSGRAMSREKSAAIRQWAKAHGLPVSERGRIASTIVEKYEAAH